MRFLNFPLSWLAATSCMWMNSEHFSCFCCTSSRPWPCLRLTPNLGEHTKLSTSEPWVTTQESTHLHTGTQMVFYQLSVYLAEHHLASSAQPWHRMDELERSSNADKKPLLSSLHCPSVQHSSPCSRLSQQGRHLQCLTLLQHSQIKCTATASSDVYISFKLG